MCRIVGHQAGLAVACAGVPNRGRSRKRGRKNNTRAALSHSRFPSAPCKNRHGARCVAPQRAHKLPQFRARVETSCGSRECGGNEVPRTHTRVRAGCRACRGPACSALPLQPAAHGGSAAPFCARLPATAMAVREAERRGWVRAGQGERRFFFCAASHPPITPPAPLFIPSLCQSWFHDRSNNENVGGQKTRLLFS